uniref:Uncharacterized protein n=1 Tax=Caenorhabditis tropicalis TaxID=1561998 RepID=A0A1I7TYX8_9PELO
MHELSLKRNNRTKSNGEYQSDGESNNCSRSSESLNKNYSFNDAGTTYSKFTCEETKKTTICEELYSDGCDSMDE